MMFGAYKNFGYRKYVNRRFGALANRINCRFDLTDFIVWLLADGYAWARRQLSPLLGMLSFVSSQESLR